jgi:hypothetical protein
MLKYLVLALLAPAVLSPAPALAQKKQPTSNAGDQNERICEDITLTGSRIASKRFCGTRAQWADKRLQDRQEVERIQRSPCVRDGTTCK